jgi:hypothetical protein
VLLSAVERVLKSIQQRFGLKQKEIQMIMNRVKEHLQNESTLYKPSFCPRNEDPNKDFCRWLSVTTTVQKSWHKIIQTEGSKPNREIQLDMTIAEKLIMVASRIDLMGKAKFCSDVLDQLTTSVVAREKYSTLLKPD